MQSFCTDIRLYKKPTTCLVDMDLYRSAGFPIGMTRYVSLDHALCCFSPGMRDLKATLCNGRM